MSDGKKKQLCYKDLGKNHLIYQYNNYTRYHTIIPAKMRFCNEGNNKKTCNRCNNQIK